MENINYYFGALNLYYLFTSIQMQLINENDVMVDYRQRVFDPNWALFVEPVELAKDVAWLVNDINEYHKRRDGIDDDEAEGDQIGAQVA